MVRLKRVVLDVLKPHQPSALEFCRAIASLGEDYKVCLNVQEMDENTQTVQLEISGASIELETVEQAVASMGASVHSIDQVDVINQGA